MLNVYMSNQAGQITELDDITEGAWVSLVNPTMEELRHVATTCDVDVEELAAALDVEEHSRVSPERGCVLILVDAPTIEEEDDFGPSHITIPIGILISAKNVITVSLQKVPVLAELEAGRVRYLNTTQKTRFTLQILMRTARSYIVALKDIEKMIDRQEAALRKSTTNESLVQMLNLEKSLVYISTSLVSNQKVLESIARTSAIKKYPDDDDLLQDTIVENEQAVEMANIYSGILSGTMDAYASVIANNQNVIIKTLALITIVLSIPTMIFSAYGMNLNLDGMPLSATVWGFALVVGISFLIALIVMMIFIRKKWF
ncbi:MAG: magnesium transporter CorA family protein [Propionibacteriaceae bacterium]|nr:magnesium transporter CorA family protein [Propionibacteriaceae bacterium]